MCPTASDTQARSALTLTVRNHAGVMSHVCGLFSRRAFNVEGIMVIPIGDGAISRIWLVINEDKRLEQMIRQLAKLEDVLEITRGGVAKEDVVQVEQFFGL